ncbi:Uncharacterised protein [Candidatus Anstonella stagnisolia]|nr:Uncharacterised protein [Candidatus Anstonella stagnisolia]
MEKDDATSEDYVLEADPDYNPVKPIGKTPRKVSTASETLQLGAEIASMRLKPMTFQQIAKEKGLHVSKVWRAHQAYSKLVVDNLLKDHRTLMADYFSHMEYVKRETLRAYNNPPINPKTKQPFPKNPVLLHMGARNIQETYKLLQSAGFIPKKADSLEITGEIEHKGEIWGLKKIWDKHVEKKGK